MNIPSVAFRPGFRTITPYLHAAGPEFLDFLKTVFDAKETARSETAPGSFHAELKIGDSMVMVGGGSGRSMPAVLGVYVPNVDAVYRRALEAGCSSLDTIRENYGDRFGCVQDSAGNQWYIATNLGTNYVRPGRNSITVGFPTSGAKQFIDFLQRAFDAEEVERQEGRSGFYALIRIHDSVIGVSEPTGHDWMRPVPEMIYMYVPDCDAVYNQAVGNGAKSIFPPADQSYGDRRGAVEDAWGNQWFVATPLR